MLNNTYCALRRLLFVGALPHFGSLSIDLELKWSPRECKHICTFVYMYIKRVIGKFSYNFLIVYCFWGVSTFYGVAFAVNALYKRCKSAHERVSECNYSTLRRSYSIKLLCVFDFDSHWNHCVWNSFILQVNKYRNRSCVHVCACACACEKFCHFLFNVINFYCFNDLVTWSEWNRRIDPILMESIESR